jgi:hypothetical protein
MAIRGGRLGRSTILGAAGMPDLTLLGKAWLSPARNHLKNAAS